MRVFSLIVLFFCSELAFAAPPCPTNMAEIVVAVEKMDTMRVTYKGAYVDPVYWSLIDLETKEGLGKALSIYQHCHIFKNSEWIKNIEILDKYSGKKIGKFSMWTGEYKAE